MKVGDTHAEAGPSGESAEATALSLGGQTVVGGTTQGGDEPSSGALIDTGDTELGRAALFPYEAEATENSASASAAAARLQLVDLLSVDVLESHSEARYTEAKSSGSSESNGVDLNLADELRVRVLHAETNSEGEAQSYVIAINDEKIVTSDQVDGACSIVIPEALAVTCVTASGGEGAGDVEGIPTDTDDAANAEVVDVNVGDGALPVSVVSAESEADTDDAGVAPGDGGTPGGDGTDVLDEGLARDETRASGVPNTGDTLAFTGANAGPLAAAAAMLIALGTAIARFGRRETEIA